MKTPTLSFFFVFALLLTSCENEWDFVPGELLVSFELEFHISVAKNLINSHDLVWINDFTHAHAALVGVPVGKEHYWIGKLIKDPVIKHAELNMITSFPGCPDLD